VELTESCGKDASLTHKRLAADADAVATKEEELQRMEASIQVGYDQADAEWIVIRRPLWGDNDTAFGQADWPSGGCPPLGSIFFFIMVCLTVTLASRRTIGCRQTRDSPRSSLRRSDKVNFMIRGTLNG
jgi:hypothetical protein